MQKIYYLKLIIYYVNKIIFKIKKKLYFYYILYNTNIEIKSWYLKSIFKNEKNIINIKKIFIIYCYYRLIYGDRLILSLNFKFIENI